MPNQFIVSNFFVSELTVGCTATDQVIHIPPSDSLKLPLFTVNFFLPLTLWDGQNPPEIVWCSQNPQTGALTVGRGLEGTSGFAWGAGTQIRSTITAEVLNAALAAYNSGLILLAGYLPLSGGTLTGPLILNADPTIPLGAATKRYVDNTEALYLPLTGGVLSGDLSLSGHKLLQVADPVVPADGANKRYVDSQHKIDTDILSDRSGLLVTAGTGAAYTLATTVGSYTTANGGLKNGTRISCRLHVTNQKDATIAVDGNPAAEMHLSNAEQLPPGIFPGGTLIDMVYVGTVWVVEECYQKSAILTTGTSTAYIAPTGLSVQALEDGLELELRIHTTNTGPSTLATDFMPAKPFRVVPGIDLYSGQCPTDCILPVRYNVAAGEWIIKGVAQPQIITPMNAGSTELINLSITATLAGANLTVALKQADGTDPSLARPIQLAFADSAGGAGPVWRQVTAPLSIVIPTGSLFGLASVGPPLRLWLVGLDNGGSIVLGVANCAQITPQLSMLGQTIAEGILQSATPISGGASSAGVIYGTLGVSGRPLRILGRLDFNSGMAAPPTFVRIMSPGMKLPGDLVQTTGNDSSDTVGITMTAPMNFVRYFATGILAMPNNSSITVKWSRQSPTTANLLSKNYSNGTANLLQFDASGMALDNPNTTGALTYKINATPTAGAPGFATGSGILDEIMV